MEGSLVNNRPDSPTKLGSVDLDQWRQEIDVFAAATIAALDAIVSELSTTCSGDQVSPVPPNPQDLVVTRRTPVAKTDPDDSAVKRNTALHSPVNKSTPPSGTGNRLASIKEKLASRMNRG